MFFGRPRGAKKYRSGRSMTAVRKRFGQPGSTIRVAVQARAT
jgi:hypothetical protein